jgi:HD superfamily phosphodiesterase
MDQKFVARLWLKIERTVTDLFERDQPSYLVYHNIVHTYTVVAHALEIAANYPLNEEELFILFAAAWFHDTGQISASPIWHEEESVKIANRFFLDEPDVPTHLIMAIGHCILATKLPQRPGTLVEEILCDADLYHLGTAAFPEINERVKQEALLRGFNVENWDSGTLRMLQIHRYHTAYCIEKLTAGKEEHIARLLKTLG